MCNIFRVTDVGVITSEDDDFPELGCSFRYLVSERKSVTPIILYVSKTSRSLPSCMKSENVFALTSLSKV